MPDEYSLLRHSLRGTINALKLGTSAMETDLTRDEAIEFLGYIAQAADKMSTLLDQYEALPWPQPGDPENQTESSGEAKLSLHAPSEAPAPPAPAPS